jgi:hypothetical protein
LATTYLRDAEQDMVVVFTTVCRWPISVPDRWVRTVCPRPVRNSLPPDQAEAGLRRDQEDPGYPRACQLCLRLQTGLGKTCRLALVRPVAGQEITLDFPGGDTYSNSIVWPSGERLPITGGLNGVFYLNHLGPAQQTVIPWRGTWLDEKTFVEEQNFDLQSDADLYTVTYTFEGNNVSITVDSSMGAFPTINASGESIE